ncbi:NAD(P)H-dependent oxidoreductase [Taibaiella koreensis]|uniref:NAD(P)H-dependent oxidoreductase n=1 Tax=Taibaiella koreensis TaxID=1268548 RepID=UPI000E59D65C|nr:NAD(P)H-dependent oxidoreductase [Taibaiella koreensis]
MKTLVIIVHPKIADSKINQRWIDALEQDPGRYTLHCLYEAYPGGQIDVAREQALIEAHDHIVFQFPFYWFSSPPLLKQWLDEVLTYGWAYGSGSGYRMSGKKVALAITAGIDEEEYQASGAYRYTLKELTAPFELTFAYIRADYKGFHAYYGIERNSSPAWIAQSVPGFLDFIAALSEGRSGSN